MNPIGIALAILLFWSLASVGGFLLICFGQKLLKPEILFWKIIDGAVSTFGAGLVALAVYALAVIFFVQ